ncbi:nectin-3-like protein [Pempheris klunzingeri]|uniref:nectin-3-like protein n=1 Tax=Pempheris klunzingeri TaxID=3127111 RepID=UPI00398033C7
MEACSKSSLILLKLIYITSLPALEAQNVWPEVTGYLGHDVTLPCKRLPGPEDNIIQFQWEFKPPVGENIIIIVSNDDFGVEASDTFLKERVKTEGYSLIIRDVEMRDAGLYTCTIATYPSGSLEGTTNLVVQEQMPLSSGVVSALVIAVVLLLAIMAVTAYLVFIRRSHSSARHCVYIDAGGPVMDMARPSVILREEDVVYSDVKFKPSRDAAPSSNDKHVEGVHVDDVMYSEVLIVHRQPKCAQ